MMVMMLMSSTLTMAMAVLCYGENCDGGVTGYADGYGDD